MTQYMDPPTHQSMSAKPYNRVTFAQTSAGILSQPVPNVDVSAAQNAITGKINFLDYVNLLLFILNLI